jgi:NAD(P)-dependent dehydrogenase (short-subunit alcohol dehydrogenase family)
MIESMQNKIALVTGANSGIGLWTVIGLAKQGATVILHARNRERGEAALSTAKALSGATRIELMTADFESQEQIQEMAARVRRKYDQLHILVNNAAIIPPKRSLTPDGIEVQFAVNHLAGFILTHDLMPVLQMSGAGRVVNVSSSLHTGGTWNPADPQGENYPYGWQGWGWYGVTKFYNVLFTYELARRFQGAGVTANCLHPGVIGTNLSRGLPKIIHTLYRMVMPGPEKGAETSVYLASSPDVQQVTGKYFDNRQAKPSAPKTYDENAQRALWDYSMQMIKGQVKMPPVLAPDRMDTAPATQTPQP